MTTKLSISLTDSEVEFLDRAAAELERTRSSVISEALRLLREELLEDQYHQAYVEWEGSEDAALWDATVADGIE